MCWVCENMADVVKLEEVRRYFLRQCRSVCLDAVPDEVGALELSAVWATAMQKLLVGQQRQNSEELFSVPPETGRLRVWSPTGSDQRLWKKCPIASMLGGHSSASVVFNRWSLRTLSNFFLVMELWPEFILQHSKLFHKNINASPLLYHDESVNYWSETAHKSTTHFWVTTH